MMIFDKVNNSVHRDIYKSIPGGDAFSCCMAMVVVGPSTDKRNLTVASFCFAETVQKAPAIGRKS